MNRSIKEVFESECGRLTINANFIKQLHLYQTQFVNKNHDHIAFFGSNLLGVHPVRFMPADRDKWFDEILGADEPKLESELLALPTVNEEFIVSSDTMNLSCAWLTHAIYKSGHLSAEQKHQGMVDAMLVLQYKFLTSRLYRHFKYPAQESVAQATYAELSGKYAIKQYGSWSALFDARADDIIGKDSIHYRAITKMDDDLDVVAMLNDIQGRIRDMLKNIYDVYLKVHASGGRINTASAVVEHDGEAILKDRQKNLSAYTRYINEIVSDKNSFMREELMRVIEKLVHTAPEKLFRLTLEWMSTNYQKTGAGVVEQVLNETLVHSFSYYAEHASYVRGNPNIATLLERLKGVYMSSRSTDPILMELRSKTESLVWMATKNKNQSVVASVRTAVLLYIVARTLTMTHYSG
jgi:septum formation topological specificity factor MinE